jgi:gas vesicle protein
VVFILKIYYMKNPFERNDHRILIGGVIAGSIIAGTAAYLFLTETGSSVRRQVTDGVCRMKQKLFGDGAEPIVEEVPEYLQKPHKAKKTDREALQKNEILPEQKPDDTAGETPQS